MTVINNSDAELALPSLSVYDTSTGEFTSVEVTGISAVAAGGSTTGTFAFSSGAAPEDTALIMLYLGDDQAAIFVTSAAYANYSPAVIHPDATEPITSITTKAYPVYIDPIPGDWIFSMDMNASYLTGTNCPSSSPTYTSSGETNLYVSNSGYSAAWYVDTSVITLNRSSITIPIAPYVVPVSIIGGFQMTAITSTTIYGTVVIQGYGISSCSGIGTFTMEALGPC